MTSQKSKKISQEVGELLVEENIPEGQKQKSSIPEHRHRVEVPEPSTEHIEGK